MRPFSPRVSTERFSFAAWLYATPHSPNAKNPKRKDTLKRPFKLIPGGVRPLHRSLNLAHPPIARRSTTGTRTVDSTETYLL